MKAILEAICAMAEKCRKEKDLFHMPYEVQSFITNEDGESSLRHSWRIEKGEEWLDVDYKSVEVYKCFGNYPDRSHLTINGQVLTNGVLTEIKERYDWDESC